jgi:hypothetical protein
MTSHHDWDYFAGYPESRLEKVLDEVILVLEWLAKRRPVRVVARTARSVVYVPVAILIARLVLLLQAINGKNVETDS